MTRSMSITLNPLTDGFVENDKDKDKDKDMVRADGHALIIATNGALRLTDMMEVKRIIEGLGTRGGSIILGDDDFIVLFNDDKAFDLAEGRFFVGSMLVMKISEDRLLPLSDEEIVTAQEMLDGRMATFVSGGQQFSALVLS